MKVCSKNRKSIALLAVNALDARQAESLRAHIETCAGCRSYLSEVRAVTEKLAQTEIASDIQTSNAFHQKIVRSLAAQQTGWRTVLRQLQFSFNWRVALPLGAAALVLIAISIANRGGNIPSPQPPIRPANVANVQVDLEPTISNYQMIANRSLEKLDELLTRQAAKNPSATPIYTASTLAHADSLD